MQSKKSKLDFNVIAVLFGNRYQPTSERLGEGGFGAVVQALDTYENDRPVALKLMRFDGTEDEQEAGKRAAEQEVELMRQLGGRGFPQLYESGMQYIEAIDEDVMWIAMELVHGLTLSCFLEDQRAVNEGEGLPGCLKDRQAYKILHGILEALEELHVDFNIVHRDLKPDNIMIDEVHGYPTILDFGIVRGTETGGDWDTAWTAELGSIRCSPQWAAPEALRVFDPNKHKPIPATDIWSLGVIAYEMIVGEHPFAQLGSDMDLCEFIVNGPNPILLPPDYQNSLLAPWIERALQRKSYMRFGDAEEARLELEKLELAILQADHDYATAHEEEDPNVTRPRTPHALAGQEQEIPTVVPAPELEPTVPSAVEGRKTQRTTSGPNQAPRTPNPEAEKTRTIVVGGVLAGLLLGMLGMALYAQFGSSHPEQPTAPARVALAQPTNTTPVEPANTSRVARAPDAHDKQSVLLEELAREKARGLAIAAASQTQARASQTATAAQGTIEPIQVATKNTAPRPKRTNKPSRERRVEDERSTSPDPDKETTLKPHSRPDDWLISPKSKNY